jgi:hypothetical protein
VPALTALELAVDPSGWRRLGFSVEGAATRLGGVVLRFVTDPGEGIVRWALDGAVPPDLDGLATSREPPGPASPVEHPNRAGGLDHVVVTTPVLARTRAALADAGLEPRRVRDAGEHRQAFYRLGEAVLELVGPVEAPAAPACDAPAAFWGLVAVVPDVDALAAELGGELLGPPRDAVQPGRRIVTVRRAAGAGVPLAFITPRP